MSTSLVEPQVGFLAALPDAGLEIASGHLWKGWYPAAERNADIPGSA